VISVVLYGRNDAHGYNLHRRAALSLNCIAEVLTDPDDEVIFVDYNTPDELPTFIEAIWDTLTERCLDRLRVLRVPAGIHEQRFAARTHLPALEPIARNVAVRRANAKNRWLLSTNTDMIFVPLQGESMSEICRDLPDGFYGLPRFELPEWLWEWLPRSDPGHALAEIGRIGPALRLDEATVSHEWIRFDAPGDFQLVLREDFLAIDGFDEEMIHGYHVDSNLSRRLLLHRGSIESLESHVSGYHCNHNRTRTVYHGSRVANDLDRFFFSVDEAELPAQRATWGLANVVVEEVASRDSLSARCIDALARAIPSGPRVLSDAYRAPFSLTYDSGHVLPFIADALVVSSPEATIGYVGANTVLQRMLGQVIDRLGFAHPMSIAGFDDITRLDEIAEITDVFVLDLGLDISEVDASFDASGKSDTSSFPLALAHTLAVVDRLVELERARCEQAEHPRPMFLVNSSSEFWDAYVLSQFDCSYTTIHSRVRRATVKLVPEGDRAALEAARMQAQRLMRWFAREKSGPGTVVIRPGESIEPADLQDYSGFGAGWATPEHNGIWTRGERSELRIGVDGIGGGEYTLALSAGMICIGSDETLRVDVHANGDRIASRQFTDPSARPWRIDLPAHVVRDGEIELMFVVDQPRSPLQLGWSTDDRRLGVQIRDLTLEPVDHSLQVGETVVFCEGSGAQRFLGDGWSGLESAGVWTAEQTAHLAFRLTDSPSADVEVALEVVPFVTAEHREAKVEFWAGGQQVGTHTFTYEGDEQTVHIDLPRVPMDSAGRALLDFHMREPARPADLGMGTDSRRLGVYLRSLTVVEPGPHEPADAGVGTLGKLRGRLVRSLRR
jgi:hypothetical protein